MSHNEDAASQTDVLLREYEKVVDLFISEGRTSWELVSIYMVVQIGLISAVALLYSIPFSRIGSLRYSFLSLAGVLTSFGWYLMQCRAKMWRDNWLLAGLRIERQLVEENVFRDPCFGIFEIENIVREEGRALALFKRCGKEEIGFRKQGLLEKGGALRIPHLAMLVIGVAWLILFMLSLLGRLNLI